MERKFKSKIQKKKEEVIQFKQHHAVQMVGEPVYMYT
jgi:hypothetical protein